MSYIKAYADLDISEKRRPADARWILQLAERKLDMRINFTPTLHGEDLAIRISDHALGLYQLGGSGLITIGSRQVAIFAAHTPWFASGHRTHWHWKNNHAIRLFASPE